MKDIENITRLLSMHAAGQETVTISADMAREITQGITELTKDNDELRSLLRQKNASEAAERAQSIDLAHLQGYACAQRDFRRALGLEVAVAPPPVGG